MRAAGRARRTSGRAKSSGDAWPIAAVVDRNNIVPCSLRDGGVPGVPACPPARLLTAVAVVVTAAGVPPPVLSAAAAQEPDEPLVFPGANSRVTYFTVHNIAAAQAVARGRGVKAGILDHSFGIDAHAPLYAGGGSGASISPAAHRKSDGCGC